MLVRDLMTRWILTVPPETTIQEGARKMRAHRIGMIPVARHGEVLGVVTDRDIAVRAVADAKHAKLTPMSDIMSTPVITCRLDHDLEEACARMQASHIRRIIVLDGNGRLAGVLSVEDIAVRGRKERLTGETLRGVARAS